MEQNTRAAFIRQMLKDESMIEPSPEFSYKALVKSRQDYDELYRRSIDEPEAFWGQMARETLDWYRPWDAVEEYGGWGYDLVFCGHGHGGIFRIPIVDKGLLSTDRTFFPEYDGGLYPLSGGGYCVVSRGLGSNTVPFRAFRLFNRPEVAVVTLHRAEDTSSVQ